ncbi:hypothetical protein C4S77_06580 [Apibacter adventoris]|uniref:Lipoprotein n=1 Tax=Apibacter adventoris TaxID=1679466 RepID=A0A2S8ACJ7_9FLAO|nr:hypothetical protein C4S77_06580 [Apibacter adventoris]
MFFFRNIFLLYTLLFLVISCHSSKEKNTLYLENNLNIQSSFLYKPQKIKIDYHKDTNFIYKIFNSQQITKYTLFKKPINIIF